MLEAVVLAGGLGTRLRGVVPGTPKAMAAVAGRPFLEILLDGLAQHGFGRVVLSVGYLAEQISGHFGNTYQGMQIAYAVEDTPLGTGGAVRLALESCATDHAFVYNGDTYLDLEVAAVERQWQDHRRPIVVCKSVADTARYGRVQLDPGGTQLAGFAEKGAAGPGLINVGCYVLPRRQLDGYLPGVPFSLEIDYLAQAVPGTAVDVFVTAGHFIDIGVPDDYARAQIELHARATQGTPARQPLS